MRPNALDAAVDAIISMFARPNPIIAGTIVGNLGLINGTQQVKVSIRGGYYTAIYLPSKAVRIPGNCFVTRMGPAEDSHWMVIATNYQVVSLGGWGSGTATFYPPPGPTTPGTTGWGDQAWGE